MCCVLCFCGFAEKKVYDEFNSNFVSIRLTETRKMWRRYLMWFAQEHIEFRHAEMESIFSIFNIPVKFVEKPCVQNPYWIVEFPSEDCVKKVASRSVLLKNCIELWSRAKTEHQLHQNLKKSFENTTGRWLVPENASKEACDTHICPKEFLDACRGVEKSFKVEVETFCKHFNMKEKVAKIESFSYLPLEGPVKLKHPDVTLSYIEFYGVDPNNVPKEPYDLFFGKWIANGQRDLIKRYTLKKRQFIGNTSMDAQLAIIMANQAKVDRGDLLLDPFVGSGSLLVAAAHFGGYVWGSDIDFMMLHARTRPTRVNQKVRAREESIRGNMSQYQTQSQYLDVIVSDFSLPLWRDTFKFDAIITDPPYGVREPTERIGIERDSYTLTEAHLPNHIPAKVEYGLTEMYRDLLQFAARHLHVGRRLVCWYPVIREDYREEMLPSHPCLELVSNSEQVLSKLTARRLLTYQRLAGDGHTPHTHTALGVDNFREKYFAMGDMTRNERKEKRSEAVAAFLAVRARARATERRLNEIT